MKRKIKERSHAQNSFNWKFGSRQIMHAHAIHCKFLAFLYTSSISDIWSLSQDTVFALTILLSIFYG